MSFFNKANSPHALALDHEHTKFEVILIDHIDMLYIILITMILQATLNMLKSQ